MANVQMPRLSDSMETGKILRWLKKEGEEVKKGEPLVEIESDKANIEVEAYASGKLSKIVVPEGESAPIGAVIAEIGGDGEGAPKAEKPAEPKGKAEKPAEPQGQAPAAEPEPKEKAPAAESPKPHATRPEAHVEQADKAMAKTAQQAADSGGEQYPHGGPDDRTEVGAAAQAALSAIRRPAAPENGERQRVSPVARRLAEEHGVDLRQVQGSGPGGRITKEDVEAAAQQGGQRQAAAPVAAPTAPGVAREERQPTPRPKEEVEVVELSKMQTTIAMRLAQSKFSAPHFYVTSEIAMDDAVRLRQMFNEAVDKSEAISINDLIIKAVALALTKFPEVNASWADGRIERKRDINIGIAVGLPDRLIVPVLRNAERMSFAEIEIAIADFAARARENKLSLDELKGGTFTVSNGGVYGSLLSTPIVNPPQSGILGLHAIQKRPVVVNDQIAIRPMMYAAVTYDHRVIDGRESVAFLKHIKELVEHPTRMLLGI